jgi:hypothetical protein
MNQFRDTKGKVGRGHILSTRSARVARVAVVESWLATATPKIPGGFVHFPLGACKSDECRDTSNHDCRCDRSIERWISPYLLRRPALVVLKILSRRGSPPWPLIREAGVGGDCDCRDHNGQ